jgi:hypothetical protein
MKLSAELLARARAALAQLNLYLDADLEAGRVGSELFENAIGAANNLSDVFQQIDWFERRGQEWRDVEMEEMK